MPFYTGSGVFCCYLVMSLLRIFNITLFLLFVCCCFLSAFKVLFLDNLDNPTHILFLQPGHTYLWSRVVGNHSKRLMRVLPLADTHTEHPCICLNSFLQAKPATLGMLPEFLYNKSLPLSHLRCEEQGGKFQKAQSTCIICFNVQLLFWLCCCQKLNCLSKNWGEKRLPYALPE